MCQYYFYIILHNLEYLLAFLKYVDYVGYKRKRILLVEEVEIEEGIKLTVSHLLSETAAQPGF